ncbi:multidrug effflux MFS transporter [Flagellimonas sp. S174]|uniref:multidrug effflux MFS transporter n=1 Tax=Flagellimonas sp. S174 TaxID=3410790 RepID=UPI003BF6071B
MAFLNAKREYAKTELEFIALMAFLMSNVALSIDAILPALTDIGNTIDNQHPPSLQYIISMIFLGLGIGQFVFGSLSDSYGRKPIVFVGVGIFAIGSVICIYSKNFETMLFGRVLQGIGLAAPKTVSISIVRDVYSGDNMARIISFITIIFVIVPMIAPIIGQVILLNFDWQAIFYFQLLFVLTTTTWFYFRQKETLPKTKRKRFNTANYVNSFFEFVSSRNAILCTLISALMEGAFIAYLSNSKHIFQNQYGLIDEFPYIFGGISLALGIATFFNGSLVLKYGMKNLIHLALVVFIASSSIFLWLFWGDYNPSISFVLMFLIIQFFSFGFIFGNVSALAMEKIGHIAGVGASLFTFTSTILGVTIAMCIGQFMASTLFPIAIGFLVCGILSLFFLKMT